MGQVEHEFEGFDRWCEHGILKVAVPQFAYVLDVGYHNPTACSLGDLWMEGKALEPYSPVGVLGYEYGWVLFRR